MRSTSFIKYTDTGEKKTNGFKKNQIVSLMIAN